MGWFVYDRDLRRERVKDQNDLLDFCEGLAEYCLLFVYTSKFYDTGFYISL